MELLANRLGGPLFTVSRSCSEQLKTPSSLASGVAFVSIFEQIKKIGRLVKVEISANWMEVEKGLYSLYSLVIKFY